MQIKNGQIGIAHNPLWYEPYDPSDPDDVEGCNRAMDFMIGWYVNVIQNETWVSLVSDRS